MFDGWRLGFDYVAAATQDAITYRDYRAQPLVVNGVRATTPDGRVRYDNLTATAAQRQAQGITSVAAISNSPNLDLVAENADKGDSWTAALTLSKSFDFGVDISAGYAKQKSNEQDANLDGAGDAEFVLAGTELGLDRDHHHEGGLHRHQRRQAGLQRTGKDGEMVEQRTAADHSRLDPVAARLVGTEQGVDALGLLTLIGRQP